MDNSIVIIRSKSKPRTNAAGTCPTLSGVATDNGSTQDMAAVVDARSRTAQHWNCVTLPIHQDIGGEDSESEDTSDDDAADIGPSQSELQADQDHDAGDSSDDDSDGDSDDDQEWELVEIPSGDSDIQTEHEIVDTEMTDVDTIELDHDVEMVDVFVSEDQES